MSAICQECAVDLTDVDREADPYTELCLRCWDDWQVQAGGELWRYPTPGTVCAACGMGFGGESLFVLHRKERRCRSPQELLAFKRPFQVKQGIWRGADAEDAFIRMRGRANSDFPDKTISA